MIIYLNISVLIEPTKLILLEWNVKVNKHELFMGLSSESFQGDFFETSGL